MRKLLLLTTFLQSVFGFSQDTTFTFRLTEPIDIGMVSVSGLSNTVGFLFYTTKKPPLQLDIDNLEPKQVNTFDRSAIYNHSKPAKVCSDITALLSFAAPVGLYAIDSRIQKHSLVYSLMYLESITICSGLTQLSKSFITRYRPYVYDKENTTYNKNTSNATMSFFSGHTCITSCNAFYTAYMAENSNLSRNSKTAIWIGAATLPAITGFLRFKAGKHFPTDIITGYIIGAAVGITVPYLHTYKK